MERSTATASLSSFIMPNLMILALARWVLWRAPVDDISLNLHKVMKAGNGRTKQFTCWHGKKWFANMGGERKSRQRARAKGWKRGIDRDEGKVKRERGGHGRMKEREVEGGKKQKHENDRQRGNSSLSFCSSGDDDAFNEATVNSHSVSPSPTDTTHKNTRNQGGKLTSNLEGLCWQGPCFTPPFHPNCNHLSENHLCSRDGRLQHQLWSRNRYFHTKTKSLTGVSCRFCWPIQWACVSLMHFLWGNIQSRVETGIISCKDVIFEYNLLFIRIYFSQE